MSRSRRLGAGLLVPVVIATAACHPPAREPPRHVVLVSIDTLRPDHLGAYGYDRPTSPRLDALAKEGVLFEDAVSPSPWTLPAHASLLTGLYPSNHRLIAHTAALSESVTTMTSLLAANGFATAGVVNSHNLSELFGLNRGFQEFEYVKEHVRARESSRRITDRATAWLREYRDQRLFLFVHYYDVHSDYRSRPEYEREFVRAYSGIADGSTAQMMAVRAGRVVFDAIDARHLVDLYDAGIRQMDEEIGRLLAEVGDGDDTLLIVTSDHGEEFLEHGNVLHGRTQFGEIMQVPLIMRGAGAPAGMRVGTTVSLIDVMPTILTAAEIPLPPGLDGVDLTPAWRGGGGALAGRYFFGEADHHNAAPDVTRAVRHEKDKLHLDRLTGLHTLFDLDRDPGELVDVASLYPKTTARLLARLADFQKAPTKTGSAVLLDSEQMERLRSLGYVR